MGALKEWGFTFSIRQLSVIFERVHCLSYGAVIIRHAISGSPIKPVQ